jgi:hypothetical protein
VAAAARSLPGWASSQTATEDIIVKEGDMNAVNWNSIIQALVLIRIGQELGTDSRLARAVHEVVQALVFVWR